mmetsp:Transcript_19760/g.40784  ORF Transcript_19760/g.40784 Transcript_19760/m.40784 type:complete len:226 (-) Transcript_19760:1009-1686(-)
MPLMTRSSLSSLSFVVVVCLLWDLLEAPSEKDLASLRSAILSMASRARINISTASSPSSPLASTMIHPSRIPRMLLGLLMLLLLLLLLTLTSRCVPPNKRICSGSKEQHPRRNTCEVRTISRYQYHSGRASWLSLPPPLPVLDADLGPRWKKRADFGCINAFSPDPVARLPSRSTVLRRAARFSGPPMHHRARTRSSQSPCRLLLLERSSLALGFLRPRPRSRPF